MAAYAAAASPDGPILTKAEKKTAGPARARGPLLGVLVLVVGAAGALLLMMNEAQVTRGPLWGGLLLLAAVGGLLQAMGTFHRDLDGARPWTTTSLAAQPGEHRLMAPVVTVPASLAVLLVGALVFGYAGLTWVILAALAVLAPSAVHRPAMLVFVVVAAIYVPLLGTFGLWDPWETHYGEVAREILARDDWISLWWAQENWFWSKPILIFWTEALSMGALDVDFQPDANPLAPEWAIRLPVLTFSMAAVMAVYAAISRIFNTRAGVLSALVMATMPHFFFLAHQAITDMFMVANVTIATCMLALAAAEDPNREVAQLTVGRFTFSGQQALVGLIAIAVIPQALYLISRNVTLVDGFAFAWHEDVFLYGSRGNHGVPGNAAAHDQTPYISAALAQPISQGLLWLASLAGLLKILWRERRAQSLYMFAFYVFCALAFMGKGIPGFALPGMVALLFLVASGRWALLFEGRFRVASGMLTIATVGLPWYVAMYIRHGPAFTDRLLVHDHINRLTVGVHGDTGSIQYFIEQMGYGTFPWIALFPAACLLWLWYQRRRPADGPDEATWRRQRDTLILVALWFFGAFALFSAMKTKFHHYIFPAEPAAAILVGILLDRLLGPTAAETSRLRRRLGTVLAVVAPLFVVLGVAGLWGDVRGVIPVGGGEDWVVEHPWSTPAALALVALGVAVGFGAFRLLRGGDVVLADSPSARSIGVLLAGATAVAAFVGRDLSWVTSARPQGYERLIQLFIYNYGRDWPEELDYRPILTGFAIVCSGLFALAVFPRARSVATRALVGASLWFCAWTLNVYMVDLSPHWGQRELVAAYYDNRASPDEPLIAWQMNWKGENFYTGNRVHVFVDLDNREVREWIQQNRGRTAFFMFEHTRMGGFQGLVRGREVEPITDKRVCNKFVVVRVTL